MTLVLIVDDDPSMQRIVRDVLIDEGYEVSAARSASEARASIRKRPPDLIILDLVLEGPNGGSFLASLSPSEREIPVILLSGVQDLHDRAAALEVAAGIQKPFDLDELVAVVRLWADP